MLDASLSRELRSIVGDAWFLDRPEELYAYSYDATPLFQHLPDAVVVPGSREEVQAILRLCSRANLKVVPRGSGTNLSAGTVPIEGGIVLALNRLNRLIEIDTDNLTATFEPGLITADLHRAVEERGLFYPPDPGSMRISTLGGNVAECAGGLRGLKYGVTKDYVIGLEAVLVSGEVLRLGGKLTKDVAGYDLMRLLIGSEGTLAVITEITVKLLPKPPAKGTMLALFADMEQSARAVSRIIAAKIVPATLEFLDNPTLRTVEAFTHAGLPTDVEAVLLIEQDGPQAVVEEDLRRIAAICTEEGAVSVKVAQSPEEGERLMTARRSALAALSRERPTLILEDATVPRSRLADMVRAVNRIAQEERVRFCTFGHAGDGNLHPTCLTDERDREELQRAEEAFRRIFLTALDLGGTITGEHGVGLAKMAYMERRIGEAGIEVMRGIKAAFDPKGLLNPGKILPPPRSRRLVVRQGA